MSRISFLIFIIIVLLTSCNHVYKKYDKESFPIYTWDSSHGITFKPVIKDITKSYKLIFAIRHIYGAKPESINVTIQTVTPSGKQTEKQYEIKVKDSNGEYISKCSGDLCDLETVVESNVKFKETGEYTYLITHNLKGRIPGIMEVGLIIDEVE